MEIDNLRTVKYDVEREILAAAKSFDGNDIETNHGYIMGLCKAIVIIERRIAINELVNDVEECENGNETV